MFNLVLFGPPGAGKGTQSHKVIEKYNFIHISTGDMFRKHKADQTPLGIEVQSLMDSGKLVPDSITIKMLEDAMESFTDAKGFIYDGFPRTIPQAEALDNFLKEKGQQVDLVLQLDVEEEVIKKRIQERQKISGRADDAQKELLIRIEEYFNKTIHVLPHYKNQNKVEKVNGMNSIDDVFTSICNKIDQ